MEQIQMTAMEYRLMVTAYGEGPELSKGRLFGYQKETLTQLRDAAVFLERRYPEREFHYSALTPVTRQLNQMELLFQEGGAPAFYSLQMTPTEHGPRYAENFYGAVLHAAYDEWMEKTLAQKGIQALAYTIFPYVMEDIDGTWTAERLAALGKALGRNTVLFLSGAADEAKAEALKALTGALGLYGSYEVCCLYEQDMEGQRASDLLKGVRGEKIPHTSFFFDHFADEV